MGDSDNQTIKKNSTENVATESLKLLQVSEPAENVSIEESSLLVTSPDNEIPEKDIKSSVKVETVFESPESIELSTQKIDEKKDPQKSNDDETPPVSSTTKTLIKSDCTMQQKDKAEVKNRSDIFALNNNYNSTPIIFSVNGVPSRKPYQRRDMASTIFSAVEQPESKPCTAKIGCADVDKVAEENLKSESRNPVTGTGVNSKDEFKSKPFKRRDGNPLLGLGYEDAPVVTTPRIPPGGYSKGLW